MRVRCEQQASVYAIASRGSAERWCTGLGISHEIDQFVE
jgi:hypothetical protein